MTDFPDLKIKMLVSFPATIIDGTGVDVVKQNGGYQFNLDFGDFAPPVSSVADPTNQNALLWNAITNQYVLAPVSILSSTVSPATAIPLPNATPGLPGGSLNYAREDHVHPTDMSLYNGTVALTPPQQAQAATNIAAVSYGGAQALSTDSVTTMGQRSQARSNIYAAPFDTQAYSGLQINGSTEVSQERGSTLTATDNTYIVDGWKLRNTTTGVVNGAQFAAGFSPVQGFQKQIAITVTTAVTSLGASQFIAFMQPIEGYRISRLAWGTAAAQPITIGFWVSAARAGQYSGSVRNLSATRSYCFPITVSAANAYEYKTVTIPGDTAGTWVSDNTIGMTLFFTMAVDSALAASVANAWVAGSFIGAPGHVNGGNGAAATSDVFRLAGVVVLPGIEAPSAARSPLIMRPFDQELLTCKWYWQQLPCTAAAGQSNSTTSILFASQIPIPMRASGTPILAKTSFSAAAFEVLVGGTWVNAAAATLTASSFNANLGGSVGGTLNGFSGLPLGAPATFGSGSPLLTLDARL